MAMRSGKRILLVEDDAEFARDLLALWHPPATIRRAACVEEAIRDLAGLVPDLVLLDLCLPSSEEQGLGLLALIRRERGRATPVIVLTSSTSARVREEVQRLGIEAFLRKPPDLRELDRTVCRVLRREE